MWRFCSWCTHRCLSLSFAAHRPARPRDAGGASSARPAAARLSLLRLSRVPLRPSLSLSLSLSCLLTPLILLLLVDTHTHTHTHPSGPFLPLLPSFLFPSYRSGYLVFFCSFFLLPFARSSGTLLRYFLFFSFSSQSYVRMRIRSSASASTVRSL